MWNKIEIVWDPYYGLGVSDGMVSKTVSDYIKWSNDSSQPVITITIGSELIIQGFRLRVQNGEIPYDRICILVGDEVITFDELGYLSGYPEGFCNHYDDLLVKLICGRNNKNV